MKTTEIAVLVLSLIPLAIAAQRNEPEVLNVPGAVFRYVAEGHGPPVIAFTGSATIGQQLYGDRLRGVIRIIHADPEQIDEDQVATLTMRTVVDDIERVRAALGVEKISVMGHSMFGTVPLEYGLAYPDHAQWLILSGALPYTTQRAFDASAAYWDTAASQERKDVRRANHAALAERETGPRTQAEQFWARYVADVPFLFANPRFEMHRFASRVGPTTNMAFLNHFWGAVLKDRDNTAAYSRVASPVLVLSGRFDFEAPYFLWDEIGKAIPDYTFHLFDDAGHNPMLEVPDAFADVLARWMRSRGH